MATDCAIMVHIYRCLHEQSKKVDFISNENGKSKLTRHYEPPQRSFIPKNRRWKTQLLQRSRTQNSQVGMPTIILKLKSIKQILQTNCIFEFSS